ncbi:hypothetical protein JCM16358_12490 [Halanaerocella petrolearia]
MGLDYIRFMIFIACIGIFLFYGLLLVLSKKYKIQLFSNLIIIWIGSLILGSSIGIDFLLQGINKVLKFIIKISPLWIIVLTLISLNLILFFYLKRINNK